MGGLMMNSRDKKLLHTITCLTCGSHFTSESLKFKYCSKKCKNNHRERTKRERERLTDPRYAVQPVPECSIPEILKLKQQYEDENKVTMSYGIFMDKIRRGEITLCQTNEI